MNASDGDRTGVSIDRPDLVDAPLSDLGGSNVSGMLACSCVANSDPWHCGSPLGQTACVGSPCLTPHHSLPRFTLRTARPTNALNEQPSWKEDERSHCTETSCPDDGHSAATPGYKCSEVAFSIPPNSTLPLNHSENTRLPTRCQYRVRRGGHTRQLRCTRRCNILHLSSSLPACPHPRPRHASSTTFDTGVLRTSRPTSSCEPTVLHDILLIIDHTPASGSLCDGGQVTRWLGGGCAAASQPAVWVSTSRSRDSRPGYHECS
jgi:hypothetical protein